MVLLRCYVLRLSRLQSIFRCLRYNHVSSSDVDINHKEKQCKSKDFKSIIEKYGHKVIFNSYMQREILEVGYFKYYLKTLKEAKKLQQKQFQEKSLPPIPVSLQFIGGNDMMLKEEEFMEPIKEEKVFQLPYNNNRPVNIVQKEKKDVIEPTEDKELAKEKEGNWMENYEFYSKSHEESEEEIEESEWYKNYGKPDPSLGISRVPCGGCGALFHSSDPAIPGYLPSEILRDRTSDELKTIECQRCHFLKEYNIALDVSVNPEEYEKLLQHIRFVKSLVILMVDLLDFPCSIWPGIVDIIGKERPLIIVGNKVDLLPGDSIGYLKRIQGSLIHEIRKTKLVEANIKHVALISAKTGYGVEQLISAMFKIWLCKGDVFLVGCTNVGKSSLFNALIQSDYCKVHAVDIIKRATVSRWPGTTLNLLKFPINRLSGWKIHERQRRLRSEEKLIKVEKEIRKAQIQGLIHVEPPSLMGHIGRSFTDPRNFEDVFTSGNQKQMTVLDEKHEVFRNSKWFYDTPGVIHPDQVLSLLTTEELLLTIPKEVIKPQTYYTKPGTSIFIGGLARIDHLRSENPCRFTIFCSENLPITVTKTEDADEVYETFLGTELFAVPSGSAERLRKWPGLKKKEDTLEYQGEGPKICCGDIVMSSVAWVSVTAKHNDVCKVAAWTPEGRGIHKRYPSLLPYSVNLKGKRIRDTPAYMKGRLFVGDEEIYK